ncbi:MAG TPA: PKD domain-containing protein [Acidobacteriota bacterium]|nr:PKD domain-containing protein [Acidobacteriota bacterium]
MTTYHNSNCGRVAITLLLITCVLVFWALPARAESGCSGECDSPLARELHTFSPDTDIAACPPPVADFCACPRKGCDSLKVHFTDYSQGYIYQWQWDFGDPASGAANYSVEENPTHWYMSPGLYTITLTVTGPGGQDSETKSHYVEIKTSPTADFTTKSRTGCSPFKVSFEDQSTYPDTWAWTFGDGGSSTEQNPSHTYTAPGTYDVTLTVTNICGDDTEKKTEYITVLPEPTADFKADPTEGCAPLAVKFTDLSQHAESWSWQFGDGTTSTDRHPTHTYNDAGVYDVTLKVSNACGDDTETKTKYITVFGGPTADFSGDPRSGLVPLTVDFKDHSTSELKINTWSWDFGDGGTSDVQDPSHTYTAAGRYTVTLTVSDECGEDTEEKVEYIYVYDICSVDFSGKPLQGCAELTVDFAGTYSGPCEISEWIWDFGDPDSGGDNAGSGQDVQHIYKAAGKYTVALAAVNGDDTLRVTKEKYVTVYGGPSAAFSASRNSGTAPLSVDFTDLSTSELGIDSWSWDFGDGGTSDAQHPTHVYTDTGTYTVELTVVDACGQDMTSGIIKVSPSLSITKEVDKTTAFSGDTLLYTLTIRNNSRDIEGPIMVVDTVPDSTGYVPGSIIGVGSYDPGEDLVRWNIPAPDSGKEVQLSFKVILDGPFTKFPTVVSNLAVASFDEPSAAAAYPLLWVSNRVETVVDEPTGTMGISKDVSATLASPGDPLTYTITVINDNPAIAQDVVVLDAIPDSTTYVPGSITGGGVWDPATDSLFWDLGDFSPFESRTLSFQVTIDPDVAGGQEIPNTALVNSSLGGEQSNRVVTAVSLVPIVITKTVSKPSGMFGDLVRFTITVENYTNQLFTDVHVIDTMPGGIFYTAGTSLRNSASVSDPAGDNPYDWPLDELPPSGTITVEYTALIGASAHPGVNENVARAYGYQGANLVRSNRAVAQIYVLSYTLTGAIRGKVMVDCDGDGIADMDYAPVGTDVYLDDGSQSRVNKEGMFYFSTVRAGERVVALDERDLDGYYIPEGAQASVFVHVHETGESYVIFRICPEYPHLDITKKASIVPTVKVTKTARLNPEKITDSLGAMVDYQIDIKSNGLADPTQVRVVDSFPSDARLMLDEKLSLVPIRDGSQLVYEVSAAQERLQKSAYYSLRDLSPGVRRFLTNKVYLEGDLARAGEPARPVFSEPIEVAVGPLQLAPPQDIQVTLTPALFITAKAFLQPPAISQLEAVADSIQKYADADIKVEGHCDYRRIHTKRFPSNWELGEARARAVVDWLVENRGVDRDRLAYESFAATRPIDTGHTEKAWQRNRRTEVIIKARVAGFIDPAVLGADKWESSTSLALDPVKFDTLFEPPPTPMEIGLDDSWEIVLTVENVGTIAAENAVLTDVLPDGVEYIGNSATIDGRAITADVSAQTLNVTLERVDPSQTIELRYRVRALQGRTPTGGGAASIEVITSNNLPVVQKSNEVRFK